MQIRKAQKSKSKIRVGLSGPSGSGKTYSALLLAHGIAKWNKICIIDTERQSADLYSDLGTYNVITLDDPFTPQKYIEAIELAENSGMEVIIVDSITHEWSECKNMVDKLGGRFQDWAKVTPIHNRFINAVTGSKAHIITTVRSKTDYAMTSEGGKTQVQKVGLKQETREGFEYELTISFDLNIRHLADTSKDRTGQFMDADPFIINEETGKKILKWAESGEDPVKLARKLEELMPIKGVSIENTLKHYKVDDLADLGYTKLVSLEDRLNEMPDKKVKENEKKKPTKKIDPEKVDEAMDEAEEEAEDEVKASPGELKMLEIVMQKRAQQIKKSYAGLMSAFLKKLKLKDITDLTKTQANDLNKMISDKNAAYEDKKNTATPEDAEKIFNKKEGSKDVKK